jgi:hypothetical protein
LGFSSLQVDWRWSIAPGFRLALVTVDGNRASPPVYVSGVDWGLPGFGDTQITKNLQQLLAAGRNPH